MGLSQLFWGTLAVSFRFASCLLLGVGFVRPAPPKKDFKQKGCWCVLWGVSENIFWSWYLPPFLAGV